MEPQVLSHVYGLKKAAGEQGGATAEEVREIEWDGVQGAEWLTSDEGAQWVLESADAIQGVVTGGKGSYAPMRDGAEGEGAVKAKL